MPRELNKIIRLSLSGFYEDLSRGQWTGRREREAVSLYVFEHLLPHVQTGSLLHSPGQIGIEVPVPQVLLGKSQKKQVCKDIVLWPEAGITCWDSAWNPTVPPMAILEWKYGRKAENVGDINWLASFTSAYPTCTGYATRVRAQQGIYQLRCSRVKRGEVDLEWLNMFST